MQALCRDVSQLPSIKILCFRLHFNIVPPNLAFCVCFLSWQAGTDAGSQCLPRDQAVPMGGFASKFPFTHLEAHAGGWGRKWGRFCNQQLLSFWSEITAFYCRKWVTISLLFLPLICCVTVYGALALNANVGSSLAHGSQLLTSAIRTTFCYRTRELWESTVPVHFQIPDLLTEEQFRNYFSCFTCYKSWCTHRWAPPSTSYFFTSWWCSQHMPGSRLCRRDVGAPHGRVTAGCWGARRVEGAILAPGAGRALVNVNGLRSEGPHGPLRTQNESCWHAPLLRRCQSSCDDCDSTKKMSWRTLL